MRFPVKHRSAEPSTSAPSSRSPSRPRSQFCLIALTVVGMVVLAAACGSVQSSSGAAPTKSAISQQSLAYARCMQAHGVTQFPDPAPSENHNFRADMAGIPGSPAARPNETCKRLLASTSTAARSTTARATASPPAPPADCLTVSQCFAPRQFRVAYGIQPLLERGITGRGVTVVLPEEAETGPARPQPITGLLRSVTDIRQDLAGFDSRFALPPARIQVITTLAGHSASPWLAGVEEVEDTELVHAVAPGATIRELLVNPAHVSTPAKLAAAFDTYVRIAARNGEVMSQSGMGQEFNLGESSWTSAEVADINSALEYAAARHVTVVVASGDYGAIGNGSSTPRKEVSLPASDPWALAAGGSTLSANHVTGAYLSETAWDTPSGSPDASGGGFSRLFARPTYQNGVPGIGATRGVPDVAGEATGTSGMALAFSAPGGGDEFVGAGGASAAAPFWAGIIALADQDAGHPLGFVNPDIYRIGRSPLYHKAFHDITTGNNTVTINGVTVTGYQAGPGWDPVTGWGSPDAQVLIPLLARYASQR
ncbi:MAG TPA: S53 family peptidase [Acidimicrobiales bacterium]|nr:S53 family peptidase [Acidimicrobiales bacterium]